MPAEGALLRLPSGGGTARLYRADSLTALDWQIPSGVPRIARALGTELEDRMVYAVDTDGRLIGLDLLARRSRVYLTAAQLLTGTPDGAVLGLDSARHPLRFSARALASYRDGLEAGGPPQLLPGPGSQIIAYLPDAGIIQLLGEEGEVRRLEAPRGVAAATWHGDLFAITTDSGVVFFTPGTRDASTVFVRLKGTPVTAAFSPSAHRLYVARDRGDVVILERFSGDELGTIELPAAARGLRVDRTGRWLLARPESGDSTWVIDLVRQERVMTARTTWADDLPLVVGGRTLVMRDGQDVVAWELTGTTPAERRRLVGAAEDVFLAIPWSPNDQLASQQLAGDALPIPRPPDILPEASTPTADAPTPRGVVAVPVDPGAIGVPQPAAATPVEGAAAIYLQISSSQNREWAQALAQQLRGGGFPARLLSPDAAGEAYRVVVGPYASRDEADAVGRRLGRPYFVLAAPPGGA